MDRITQELITEWITMTVMVIDTLGHSPPGITATSRKSFEAERRIPEQAVVMIARFDGHQDCGTYQSLTFEETKDGDNYVPICTMVSLAVGSLAFFCSYGIHPPQLMGLQLEALGFRVIHPYWEDYDLAAAPQTGDGIVMRTARLAELLSTSMRTGVNYNSLHRADNVRLELANRIGTAAPPFFVLDMDSPTTPISLGGGQFQPD
jgi:hypothetical protein